MKILPVIRISVKAAGYKNVCREIASICLGPRQSNPLMEYWPGNELSIQLLPAERKMIDLILFNIRQKMWFAAALFDSRPEFQIEKIEGERILVSHYLECLFDVASPYSEERAFQRLEIFAELLCDLALQTNSVAI